MLVPVEHGFYRLTGLQPARAMTWPQYAGALLGLNLVWLAWAVGILLVQDRLPF